MLILFNRHQVLPYAIQKLQAAGYQLVTLAECLEMPAYQSVVAPGTPDVSPLLAFFLLILWRLSDPTLPLHLPFAVKLALLGGNLDLEPFFRTKEHAFSRLPFDLQLGHCCGLVASELSMDSLKPALIKYDVGMP